MKHELTIKDLKEMEPNKVFSFGKGYYPKLAEEEVLWVAKRGNYHDWTIYYGPSDWSRTRVEKSGKKVFSEEVIKTLVPCDDEAFKMYRF